jgi:hypothetical protein
LNTPLHSGKREVERVREEVELACIHCREVVEKEYFA